MKIIRIIVTLGFVWSALKSIEILSHEGSLDMQLFSTAGMSWLLFALIVPCAVCYVWGTVWVWRHHPGGFVAALAAIGLNFVETASGVVISMKDTELAKKCFIASREARGLPVPPDILSMMDNPKSHLMALGISVFFTLIWLYLVLKVRNYHRQTKNLEPQCAVGQALTIGNDEEKRAMDCCCD